MGIKYYQADDIKKEAQEIASTLNWKHIDFSGLGFLRSHGSSSRGTIARCHALGKAMQMAMGRTTGFYLVEVISEKFDRLPRDEQTKTIIHELMHIPKTFGGGFIHHDKVHEKNVRIVFEQYMNLKKRNLSNFPSSNTQPETPKTNLVFREQILNPEKKFRWF